jgi:hypothetical protein
MMENETEKVVLCQTSVLISRLDVFQGALSSIFSTTKKKKKEKENL